MKIAALITEYHDYQEKTGRHSPATRKGYTHHLRRFNEAHIGLTLGGLTAAVVRRFIAEETARSRHAGYVCKAAITSFCAYLKAEGHITVKPTDFVERIKAKSPESKPATTEEIRALFDAARRLGGKPQRRTRAGCFIALLAYGGLRISEALGVEARDFNPVTGELFVRHGKGGNTREIFPCAEAFPFILAQMKGKKETDRLIPLTLSGGESYFARLRTLAKCEHVTSHKLRHAVATRMLENGESVVTVQHFLGHGSLATTGLYLHTTRKILMNAAKSGSLNPVPKEETPKPSQQPARTGGRRRTSLR
jgi:site-specific recombinase XerD